MNKKPEVSVVVPAYNVEEYIGQCLKSILKQTFENIEILCIDDGSRDRTVDIIREYMAKDGRIRLLEQEHQYAGAARNAGIDASRGAYLLFWDADDFF